MRRGAKEEAANGHCCIEDPGRELSDSGIATVSACSDDIRFLDGGCLVLCSPALGLRRRF